MFCGFNLNFKFSTWKFRKGQRKMEWK